MQMDLDVLGVERLEGAVVGLLEEDGDGHDLAGVQPLVRSRGQQLPLQSGCELLPELIDRAEELKHTHGWHLLALGSVAYL